MLDLGTLGVRVSANTGDTVSRLDEVRSSLENLEDKSAASASVIKSSTTESAESFEGLGDAVNAATKAATGDISGFVSQGISMFGQLVPGAGIAAAAISGIVDAIKTYSGNLDNFIKTNQDTLYAFAGYADEIATNATITGLSTDFVNLYTAMTGLTDVSFSSIETACKNLNKNIGDAISGDKGAIKKFKDLNIAIYGEDGKPRSTEDIFTDVISTLQKLPTEAEQVAAAMDIFGANAAAALMPIITNADLSYEKLNLIASEYNLIATGKELSLAQRIQDMKDLKDAAEKTAAEVQSLLTAETQIAADEAALQLAAAKTAFFRGEISYADYMAAMGKSAEANEANKARNEAAYEVNRMMEVDQTIAELEARGNTFVAGIIKGLGLGSSGGWLYGDVNNAERIVREAQIQDDAQRVVLDQSNPVVKGTLEHFAELYEINLEELSDEYVDEINVMAQDYYSGAYSGQDFWNAIEDMFSAYNNNPWEETTNAIKEGFKDVQINNTVIVDTQSNVDFYTEATN